MSQQCNNCNLCKNTENPCLMGRGAKSSTIMFVQDIVTPKESETRKQFAGKDANNLMSSLERRGIDTTDCYFTSAVKCPLRSDTVELTQGMAKYCLDYLYAEIQVIDPDIIVPMGNQALKAVLGKTGITKFRGNAQVKEVEGKERIILPIIHPAQVARKPMYQEFILKDLDTLADIYDNGMNEVQGVDYSIAETKEEAIRLIRQYNEEAEWLCFDLETTGKQCYLPNNKIVCISLSMKPYTGCAIPLFHRDSPIPEEDMPEIIAELKVLLENPRIKKVAHNGKFDISWLSYHLGIDVVNFCFDTLLAHYIAVSEEQGTQGLKGLAWEYTDMGGYDNELDEARNKLPEDIRYNYDLVPWNVLSKYAVCDVDCCLRLKDIFLPLVEKNPKWVTLMNDFLIPASYALREVERTGMLMDDDKIEKYTKTYAAEIQRIQSRLESFPEVVEIERERQAKWAERETLKAIPKKDRTPEEQRKFEEYNKYKNYKFNWNSSGQLGELLFGKLGLTTDVLTKKGEKSTNEEALIQMAEHHEIPTLMLELRKVTTLNNMFIKTLPYLRDENGMVHPSFNLSGTVTGRLASENPNAQQLPRKSENPLSFQYQNEIKGLFSSRFGDEGCILNADYSQLELRIAGVISGDKVLEEVYVSGADLHIATASKTFKVPIEEVTKDLRTKAKSVGFGIIYGKSGATFGNELFLGENEGQTTDPKKATELGNKLVDDYLNAYPDLGRWLTNTKKHAKKHGYVETMLGRRRRLPDLHSSVPSLRNQAERQSINAPIQGTGSDLTLRSIIEIQQYIKDNKLKSKMICTVHDSIVFDIYIPELAQLARAIKDIMEHVHEPYIKTKVPILSELELGDTYGGVFEVSLEEVSKILTVEDFNEWLHEQKIGKYTKEIKAMHKAGFSVDNCIEYLDKNERPVEELVKVIMDVYSE